MGGKNNNVIYINEWKEKKEKEKNLKLLKETQMFFESLKSNKPHKCKIFKFGDYYGK